MRASRVLASTVPAAAMTVMLAACGGTGSSVGNHNGGGTSILPSVPAGQSSSAIPKQYVLTDLGTGLPGSPGLVPAAVNNSGVAVGSASINILGSLPSCSNCGPPEGWIFKNGSLHQLPPLGTDSVTFGDDINNSGVVSGGSAGNTTEEAALWNPNGSITNLGTGIAGTGSSAEAISISNGGKIVGISYSASATVPTAFDGKGGASAPCGTSTQGYLTAVNDNGLASGIEFLSQGGNAAVVCPPFAAIETPSDPTFWDFAFDINDRGQVVGRLTPGNAFAPFHAFSYQTGTTTDLGTLSPNNASSVSGAFGVNDSGMIVGFSADGGAVPGTLPINPRAFVYSNGKMVDLNSLLPAGCAGWTLVVANAINDNGQIVGAAYVGGYPNGVEHGFLLTPVN